MTFKYFYGLPCVGSPEINCMITRARGEVRAIRRPGDTIDRISMICKGVEEKTRVSIPDANSVIARSRGEVRAIRRPGDTIDLISMNSKGVEKKISVSIPDANSLITRARGEACAIRRPGQLPDHAFMPLEHMTQRNMVCGTSWHAYCWFVDFFLFAHGVLASG